MTVMAPVAMIPVVAMPVAVMPVTMTPMTVVPMMMVPAHLHGLDLVDFVLRHDCRLNVRGRGHLGRNRRHRRSLCACAKQDRTGNQASSEIQEIPKPHDFKPFHKREKRHAVSSSQHECSLNPRSLCVDRHTNNSRLARNFRARFNEHNEM